MCRCDIRLTSDSISSFSCPLLDKMYVKVYWCFLQGVLNNLDLCAFFFTARTIAMRFRFRDRHGAERFDCNLVCLNCTALKRNGGRCTRRVCQGLQTCWQHLRTFKDEDKGLKIQPSNIAGAGKGLFAWSKQGGDTIVFKPNEVIAPYYGDEITRAELFERYGQDTGPYALEGQAGLIVDAACRRGVGSLANGSRGSLRPNARFADSYAGGAHRLVVRATKNIRHGQEIIIAYGAHYWQTNQGIGLTSR